MRRLGRTADVLVLGMADRLTQRRPGGAQAVVMTQTDAVHASFPTTGSPVLQGRSLRKAYGATLALDGVDLDIAAGESIAIIGPSGSGKTTLLHVLAGIVSPDSGTVCLRGREVQQLSEDRRSALRRSDFGFVFQSGQLLGELTAVENVALPLMVAGMSRQRAVAEAARWFGPLGLDGREGRRPGELSGGQAQRVAIARAVVHRPSVVFADEPTGALDQATGAEVMALLSRTHRETGAALVVVTHDPGVAAWCDRTVEVRDGRLADAR